MRNLHNDYLASEANHTAYEAAEKTNDEAGIEAARESQRSLLEQIHSEGPDYERIFSLYESARERGNDLIDLDDCIWDDKVPGLIEALRTYGIERFTFSSTWSSAVETAWLFLQNGCRLEGLIEINSRHKAFLSDEYEKVHGYLFSLT